MLHPAMLPPGTVVGSWRVVAWAGRGGCGAVYRAVPKHSELAPPVALKMALIPGDPRFAREVELLSRMRHPSIPRLWDSGEWHHPSGALYPFLVMEWVDGVPLYEWARMTPATSTQVPRLLTQLARALQAVHARAAVHRDVKGDNILVRRSDGRAVLTDFGSGIYPDTATLTPPAMYPGTPAYRSPESWLFELQFSRDASARYAAGPADDLYALGVTACRLMTGKYPELPEPRKDEHGLWRLDCVLAPAELRDVEPGLGALILRLLSVRPRERGTAAQLAEALEQAQAHARAESPPRSIAEVAPAARPSEPSSVSPAPSAPLHSPLRGASAGRASAAARARPWRPWLVPTAASLILATWVWWLSPGKPVAPSSPEQPRVTGAEQPDAGTAGLAEALASASTNSAPGLQAPEAMAEDTPPEPEEEQARPDAKGRCPHKRQVALNGACWLELSLTGQECEDSGGHMFKRTCYVPVIPAGRKHTPTSSPSHKRHPAPR
ncbi:MAG: protein kinase domain-containing protein [Hyalangium sp.]|uniref:protein kinase domain-containing protein n=1 Tax=Hyalangium sp. TaxID=2028555 RepID=UPI00389A2A98